MDELTITINGNKAVAGRGDSILEACKKNGVELLTLCHLEGLKEVGACRLCLVEVEGVNKLLPACTTKVTTNMQIMTETEKIKSYQRITVELFFAERNHVCAVCVANGSCELQELGYKVGMDHIRYPFLFPKCEIDSSHPSFVLDHNRCILCTRCIRACAEVEGAFNWNVMNRGSHTRVISDFNTPWGESSTCTSCGKCVHACPTGALWMKDLQQGSQQLSSEKSKHPEMLAELMRKRTLKL